MHTPNAAAKPATLAGIYRTDTGTRAYVPAHNPEAPTCPAWDIDLGQQIPRRTVDTTQRLRAAKPQDFYTPLPSGRRH